MTATSNTPVARTTGQASRSAAGVPPTGRRGRRTSLLRRWAAAALGAHRAGVPF
ncbi:hypothetical protein [Actinomycetospora chibensis]|uniref:Uncharacterized protein n=1 Tax=Actinomycetospora chibensis TaxID=663606 RepID=A0ABV9RSQ9_9PSEU|nr:hypothetical protein [Actinomycetospora chibensis]MDD7927841.1 hypothetical protein [Actinomycetospora chibensis]